MPGIQVVEDRVVVSPPVLILVFIFIIVFVTMVNGNGTHHFCLNTKICLCSAAVALGGLGGCGYAQKHGEKRGSNFERLHAGENVHAYNLPSTLIAGDGTALCLSLKIPGVGDEIHGPNRMNGRAILEQGTWIASQVNVPR